MKSSFPRETTAAHQDSGPRAAKPGAQALAFTELDAAPVAHAPRAIDSSALHQAGASNPLRHVKTRLAVRVGTVEVTVGDLLNAKEQQVLRLDQAIEQPVDILLGADVVARGTLVAVDDHFGVRITELPRPLLA